MLLISHYILGKVEMTISIGDGIRLKILKRGVEFLYYLLVRLEASIKNGQERLIHLKLKILIFIRENLILIQ
jgi:hypothetical protein